MFRSSTTVGRAVGMAVMAIAGVLGVAACGGQIAANTPASNGVNFVAGSGTATYFEAGSRAAAPAVSGTTLSGARLSLSSYRGQVVVLTFLYSTCGDTCIVIGQQIRGALNELEEEHVRTPAVVIVSADPTADSPAHVRSFLSQVSLTGRVRYLTGPLSRLRSIWRAYDVKPASVGAREFDEYAPVLLLDPSGRKRVLFESEELTPEALSHDVRKLD